VKHVRRFPPFEGAANSIALELTIRIAGLTQLKFDYSLIFFTIDWRRNIQRIPIEVDSSRALHARP
jgi:hypothetical protein